MALGMMLIVSTSAVSPASSRGEALQVGDTLPEMKQSAKLALQWMPRSGSGRMTLVHFWAAYDAQSRATNVVYDRYFSRSVSDRIAYYAISLDPVEAVHRLTLERDGLDLLKQYCASDLRQELIVQYGLQDTMHSYLIDESGRVLSVDPSIEELNRFYHL